MSTFNHRQFKFLPQIGLVTRSTQFRGRKIRRFTAYSCTGASRSARVSLWKVISRRCSTVDARIKILVKKIVIIQILVCQTRAVQGRSQESSMFSNQRCLRPLTTPVVLCSHNMLSAKRGLFTSQASSAPSELWRCFTEPSKQVGKFTTGCSSESCARRWVSSTRRPWEEFWTDSGESWRLSWAQRIWFLVRCCRILTQGVMVKVRKFRFVVGGDSLEALTGC